MKHTQITMRYRVTSLLTALLLVFAMAAAALPEHVLANTDEPAQLIYTYNKSELTASVAGVANRDYATQVNIPATTSLNGENYAVTSIENTAFTGCTNLTAFTAADDNASFSVTDGVLFSKDYSTLAAYPAAKTDTTYTIPDSVRSIRTNAFASCTYLQEIDGMNAVEIISQGAFKGCTSLKKVTMPEGITGINNFAFSGCTNLEDISLPNSLTYIGTAAFQSCEKLESITIPDNVTTIWGSAFDKCLNLRDIKGMRGVTKIDWAAFSGCTSLENVNIPDAVTTLESSIFSGCTNLKSVTIPDSVTKIEFSAFGDCNALENIVMSNGITEINGSAFPFLTKATKVLVMFDPTDNMEINNTITRAGRLKNVTWYRGCRSFADSTADPIDITVEPGTSYDLYSQLGITDTIYEGQTEDTPYEGTDIAIPAFTLSGNTSKDTKLINDGKTLTLGRDESGTLLLKTYGRTIRVNFHSLAIDDLTFPELEFGKTPQAQPLQIRCTGNANVTIDEVKLNSDSFLLDDSRANTEVGAGQTNSTYLVTPKAGLLPGVYRAKVTITYGYGSTAEADIALTVKEATPTSPVLWCTLIADALSFPEMEAGDIPQPQPLQLHCSGSTGASITKVALSGTGFLLDDSKAEAYVGPGKTNSTYLITPKAGLAPGTYKAKVTITYSYGKTAEAGVTLTVTEATQKTPAKLTAKSKNYRTIALSWKKAVRAEKYQVYRATKKNGTYKRISTTSKTSLNNSKLATGKTYYYKVRAYRTAGGKKVYSPFTKIISAVPKPSAPSFSLKAGKGRITVSWKGVSGATGYRVYQASAKNGRFVLVKDSRSKARRYANAGLRSKKTYYYKLRAYRVVNDKKIYSSYTKIKAIKTK